MLYIQVASIINLVDCSGSPSCATLNRANCLLTAQTCSSCKTGYKGVFIEKFVYLLNSPQPPMLCHIPSAVYRLVDVTSDEDNDLVILPQCFKLHFHLHYRLLIYCLSDLFFSE